MTATLSPITKKDASDLARLEQTIDRGMATFVEVGLAVLEIRDRRLYRETHKTFEAYCRERWSFTRAHGNRLVSAAEVARNLATAEVQPTSEGQVRSLAGLEPDEQRAAWDEASADGQPTASKVETAAEELRRMSADEKLRTAQKEEREASRPAATPRSPDRVKNIEGLVRKLKKIHAGLTDVADEADAALDAYLAVIGRSGEE